MKRASDEPALFRSTRRTFLEFLALEATFLAVGCSGGGPRLPIDPDPTAISRATAYGGEASLAQLSRVGQAYLGAGGEEAEAQAVALAAQLETYATDQDAVDGIAADVRADFEDGNVRTVEGWTLSLTECALCALLTAAT